MTVGVFGRCGIKRVTAPVDARGLLRRVAYDPAPPPSSAVEKERTAVIQRSGTNGREWQCKIVGLAFLGSALVGTRVKKGNSAAVALPVLQLCHSVDKMPLQVASSFSGVRGEKVCVCVCGAD